MMEAILSWIKTASAITFGLMAVSVTTDAIANSIVVRSTGPSAKSYPPGKALAANSKLSLQAGDMVTVLDAKGTRVLRGPGSISISSPTTATGSAINQLLRNTNGRQARIGATRGTGQTVMKSPNLWFVDTAKGGTICLEDLSTASLWRPGGKPAQTMSLSADGKSANIIFRTSQTVSAWPVKDMPIVEGKDYRLAAPGTEAVTVRFAKTPASNGNPAAVAEGLIAKGCAGQLELLVDTGSTAQNAG